MADRVMLITWGENIAGREAHGLEVFNEAIGMYGRLQEEGKIEKFDVAVLSPQSDLQGYIAVYGTQRQLGDLHENEDFQRNIVDASLVVKNLHMADGYVGEGVAKQITLYQEAVDKVPQMA